MTVENSAEKCTSGFFMCIQFVVGSNGKWKVNPSEKALEYQRNPFYTGLDAVPASLCSKEGLLFGKNQFGSFDLHQMFDIQCLHACFFSQKL